MFRKWRVCWTDKKRHICRSRLVWTESTEKPIRRKARAAAQGLSQTGGINVDDPKQLDHGGRTVHLPQPAPIDATFRRYQLVDPKLFSTSIDHQARLPTDQSPASTAECAITRDVPHREAVVTFTWATLATRSDTTSAAATVAHFVAKPRPVQWEAVEWIPRYPPDTHDLHFLHGEQPTRVRSTRGRRHGRGLARHLGACVPHRWRHHTPVFGAAEGRPLAYHRERARRSDARRQGGIAPSQSRLSHLL